MLASYRAVKRKRPELGRNSGSKSLFEPAVFQDFAVLHWSNAKSSTPSAPRRTMAVATGLIHQLMRAKLAQHRSTPEPLRKH